jgi:hypothetical protein
MSDREEKSNGIKFFFSFFFKTSISHLGLSSCVGQRAASIVSRERRRGGGERTAENDGAGSDQTGLCSRCAQSSSHGARAAQRRRSTLGSCPAWLVRHRSKEDVALEVVLLLLPETLIWRDEQFSDGDAVDSLPLFRQHVGRFLVDRFSHGHRDSLLRFPRCE